MSPRLRAHVITAVLYAALVFVILLLYALRHVLVYLLFLVLAAVLYYGLYRIVSVRLRRADEEAKSEDHTESGGGG